MFPVSQVQAAALAVYVKGGGTVVTWFFSGIADQNLHVVPGGYPGVLRELLGVRVTELHPLDPAVTITLSDGSEAGIWSERVVPAGAEVITTYDDGEIAGLPAITRHAVGTGHAWYVSTSLKQKSLDRFIADLAHGLGVLPTVTGGGQELETVRRRGRNGTYLFILNHGSVPRTLRGAGVDLVTGSAVDGAITVVPRGVAVVRESGSPGWSVDPA